MKFIRRAKAHWKGSGMEGSGTLTTQSNVLKDTPYSFHTRFKDEVGTNPEELVGAAHSGCFAMQLSFMLGEEGYSPESLEVDSKITFEDGNVTHSTLTLKGKVPGIGKEDFEKLANKAKDICPISKLLKAEIVLESKLKN
ncbi:OsmC family protein [Zeaxanthinibacter enoshimensis]|uniref:Osmotically inducible protein OsmC n=1 Tax=Zeaxanthinibacter enoshimensis TaxID=392009 RepID=A0A4R6TNN2_9FLAO|nr:OsmC family protein [Zeaxanthinibacter enoshimensis]TDQ31379.1 osmotically inducible protein OsmC [Zeaxanthinibacter enoshimensis]